ncbi:MAG: mercury resistance protein [candidate division NC10 bacterium]|nr:mercury resistance protein [candidate division NC10 bacterium]
MEPEKVGAPPPARVRRGLWWLTAAITCPCHLPLVLILLGGTAVGAALTQNLPLVLLGLTVAFIFSLALALKGSRRVKGG